MIEKFEKYKFHYIFITILYAGGIFWRYVPFMAQFLIPLTPYVLTLTAILMILFSQQRKQPLIIVALIICLFTFTVEAIGVNTGLLFGHYEYSDIFGIAIFDTPLLIGVNWFIVIFGAYSLISLFLNKYVKSTKFNKFLIILLLMAIIATTYDYLLEPVAIKLNYWQWEGGIIPLTNYLTWFVISLISGYIILIKRDILESKFAAYVFLIHIAYYLILNIIL